MCSHKFIGHEIASLLAKETGRGRLAKEISIRGQKNEVTCQRLLSISCCVNNPMIVATTLKSLLNQKF